MSAGSRRSSKSKGKAKGAHKKRAPARRVVSEPAPSQNPPVGPGWASGQGWLENGRNFFTVRDRKKCLPELPSLKDPLTTDSQSEPRVDSEVPPPLAPTLPIEPKHDDSYYDCGMPVPDGYGLDRVVALARDPNWIYVYWELLGGNLERLRFKYSAEVIEQARWVLRVQVVHLRKTQLADVDLQKGHWYLWATPKGRYRIELGFVKGDGTFVSVCKSEEVVTPSRSISSLGDEQWMIVKKDLDGLMQMGYQEVGEFGEGGERVEGGLLQQHGSRQAAPKSRTPIPRARAFFSGLLPQE